MEEGDGNAEEGEAQEHGGGHWDTETVILGNGVDDGVVGTEIGRTFTWG